MGEAPDAALFEFWELPSHSIEEQLLMYDIPFTDNIFVELKKEKLNPFDKANLDFSLDPQYKPKPKIDDEEELYIPQSRIKEEKQISVESLIKANPIKPKTSFVPPEQKQQIEEREKSPRLEIKVDKYGFVVGDEESDQTQVATPGRERANTARKKNHKTEIKWRLIAKNLNLYLGEKRRKLKKLLRRGVPDSLRAEIWKGLMDVNSIKNTSGDIFNTLLEQDCSEDFERVILKDLPRTLPQHIMFQEGGHGRESLHKILKAYSLYNPSVGYCQGMGFLVGMFLIYMPAEDAFFMLVQVMDKLSLSGIFAEGLKGVKEHLYIHSQLSKSQFPKLLAHLEETVVVHGCMPVDNPWDVAKLYATQWFFNIYVHVLPFEFILRIWDILLYDGFMVTHQVALAILKLTQKDLLKLSFDTLLMFLKDIDVYMTKNVTPDQFITTCTEFKVAARITKLSKVYMENYRDCPM